MIRTVKIVMLAAAGSLGTLARYWLGGLAQRIGGTAFPWGTLAVNIVGCFFAGLLWAVYEHHWQVSAETRLIVLVGFMGAFTTFSAFILDTGHIIKTSDWIMVVSNIFLQNGLGIAFLFAGMYLGRMR